MVFTGQPAFRSGQMECTDCGRVFYVERGDMIPECPCGGGEFHPAGTVMPAHRTVQAHHDTHGRRSNRGIRKSA